MTAAGNAQPAPATLLRVDDLHVTFDVRDERGRRRPLRAVDGVSLRVREREVVGLVGESGSGKSTLARAILRLVPVAGGSIRFRDRDVTRLRGRELLEFRRRVQVVFQDPIASLNPRMSVEEIVAEGLRVHRPRDGRAARRERVAQLLRDVGLSPDDMRRYPHAFSGGQRQRIGIARALAVEPELLICDEPVSALDVSIQAQVLNLLAELQAKRGMSCLFIAHNLAVVRTFCDWITVLYAGRVAEHGPAAAVFSHPGHPYTADLLAAAPEPDPARRTRLRVLTGEPPGLEEHPPACRYASRCRLAEAKCRRDPPPAARRGADHAAHCHHAWSGVTVP